MCGGWRAALDPDVAIVACATTGAAVQHASPGLRADRPFVLAALALCSDALRWASEDLQRDERLSLAAATQRGYERSSEAAGASGPSRADREEVLQAVATHGLALLYAAPDARRGGREVVLAGVVQNGRVLAFASDELQVCGGGSPKE